MSLSSKSSTPSPSFAFEEETSAPAPRKFSGLMGYLLGLLTTAAVVGGFQLFLYQPAPPPVVLHAPPTLAPTDTPAPTATPLPPPTPAPITIFVSGAVQKPGLYQLPAEARVGEAIALAGGLLADASPDLINQAEKLWDGAHLHIPTMTDAAVAAAPAVPAGISGGRSAPVAIDVASSDGTFGGGLINLNSASLEQLDSLPGIGPSKAQSIIDNRPYATVDDLDRVSGIGPSTIEQLRSLVTVQ